MITEIVEVADVISDKIIIKFSRKSTCANCKLGSFCGKEKDDLVSIDKQSFELKKGDRIEIGIEEKKSLLISSLIFFIPIVIFIILLTVFRQFNELTSFTIAVSALFCYYLLVKVITKRKNQYFKVSILRRI